MQIKFVYLVLALGMVSMSLTAPVTPEVNDDRGALQIGRHEATSIKDRGE